MNYCEARYLIYSLKHFLGHATYGAPVRWFALDRIAAVLADVDGFLGHVLSFFQYVESGLIQAVVDLLNLIRQVECVIRLFVAFSVSLLHKIGIHLGKFVMLTTDCCLQVVAGRFYPLHDPQVITGMDGLGLRCGAK